MTSQSSALNERERARTLGRARLERRLEIARLERPDEARSDNELTQLRPLNTPPVNGTR